MALGPFYPGFFQLAASARRPDAAHEGHDHGVVSDAKSKASAGMPMKPKEVGNKICPVSGEKIPEPGAKGDMGESVKYEYNGKIYNLCCKMCIKDFKKDPEKYSKKAEAEVKASADQSTGQK